jgi:type IV secretion system protein TrbL
MIWPATSRWARRLVELLVAIVLAKFVIVAILSLASAALANTTLTQSGGDMFERMLAGAALLVLAAWSPFALLRLIPMMEVAAATVVSQRATISNATGAAGIQTPAAYMRQAMDRHSRPSASPRSEGGVATTSVGPMTADASAAEGGRDGAGPRSGGAGEEGAQGNYAPRHSSAGTATRSEGVPRAETARPSPQPRPRNEPPESAPPDHPRRARPPRPPGEED